MPTVNALPARATISLSRGFQSNDLEEKVKRLRVAADKADVRDHRLAGFFIRAARWRGLIRLSS